MKVVLRDSDGVPVCPPPNLTPANLTLRDNIHAQLSRYKTVSNKPFYRSEDIDSKNEITTFKTTDPIWMFHEPSQDFIKGNITGCLNGLFSVRSSNKKMAFTSIKPTNLFKRNKSGNSKPNIAEHAASVLYPMADEHLLSNNSFDVEVKHDHTSDALQTNNASVETLIDQHSMSSQSSLTHSFDKLNEQPDDYMQSEMTHLDEEFLEEMGLDQISDFAESDDEYEEQPDHHLTQDLKHDDLNPWQTILTIPERKVIYSTASSSVEIFRKDAELLLPGRWLNDQILNFFIENGNNYRLDEDEKYESCRSAYMCNTWFFCKLANVSRRGELGT
jgi:Ulp1 family protease